MILKKTNSTDTHWESISYPKYILSHDLYPTRRGVKMFARLWNLSNICIACVIDFLFVPAVVGFTFRHLFILSFETIYMYLFRISIHTFSVLFYYFMYLSLVKIVQAVFISKESWLCLWSVKPSTCNHRRRNNGYAGKLKWWPVSPSREILYFTNLDIIMD